MKVTMTFKKSTKGTHVYEDESPNTAIPTLYIKKAQLEKEFGVAPLGVTVTVEELK